MRRAGRFDNNGKTLWDWRRPSTVRLWRNCISAGKALAEKRWLALVILLISLVSLHRQMQGRLQILPTQSIRHNLWTAAPSLGWQPSCAQRSSEWFSPPRSNGYLVVRCNGGVSFQRIAICNAVLVARIMNATLVLPHLDSNTFLPDENGFPGIYNVNHFIKSLKNDVRVIRRLPSTWFKDDLTINLKPFRMNPPRDAGVEWYETIALEKMLEHGALFLSPFSHRVADELDVDNSQEYQRLRCRVNYHALKFNMDVRNLSTLIVNRLRAVGPYMAIHLRFEMDMLAFAGCNDTFNATEQETLKTYRKENFADKEFVYVQRRLIGKCPMTPHEIGQYIRSLGFDNSTRIYLAVGDVFGGDKFLDPLKALFPLIETRKTVARPEELALVNSQSRGSLGPAIDYVVCLLSEIFVPTFDGPSNFANNLIGQRLYYGFRTTLQPDRKALAPLFMSLEDGSLHHSDFDAAARASMVSKSTGGPHSRVPSQSFYTNPWPECFCLRSARVKVDQCPRTQYSLRTYEQDQDDIYSNWEN